MPSLRWPFARLRAAHPEIVERSPQNFSTTDEHSQKLCVRVFIPRRRSPGSRVSQEAALAQSPRGKRETLWVLPLRRIGFWTAPSCCRGALSGSRPASAAITKFTAARLCQLLIRY